MVICKVLKNEVVVISVKIRPEKEMYTLKIVVVIDHAICSGVEFGSSK